MKTRKIAFCAICAALCTTLLYLGSVTDILDLSFSAAASVIIAFAVIETGAGLSLLTYAVTAVISFLILPVKSVCFVFAVFSGIYPVLKYLAEKNIKNNIILWSVKVIYFLAADAAIVLMYLFVFGEIEASWIIAAYIVLSLAAQIIFDILLTKLISLYIYKIRKRFHS